MQTRVLVAEADRQAGRRLHRVRPSLSLLGLLFGLAFVVGSYWLLWDFFNSYLGFLNMDDWYARWRFYLPFYLLVVYPSQHSMIFDLAMLTGMVGTLLIILSAFHLGRFVEKS